MSAMFPAARHMARALALAEAAARVGEVPVGAVVVGPDGAVVGEGANRTRGDRDPTAHAEIVAIRAAAARIGDRLDGCSLWVTLEPCAMCAGAMMWSRIGRLYFGASDAKGGAVEHGARLFHQPTALHRPEVYGGIGAAAAGALLRTFFAARRG